MPDMLVRLYDLPPIGDAVSRLSAQGIDVRRATAADKDVLMAWTQALFATWVSEVSGCFEAQPASCFICVQGTKVLGFAAYDVTCKNFFGPTGVAPEYRERGIGTALTLSVLHAQKTQGYAYAIIGGVGPAAYYEKLVDAVQIEHSTPGIYREESKP